jgi:hypothetical protein
MLKGRQKAPLEGQKVAKRRNEHTAQLDFNARALAPTPGRRLSQEVPTLYKTKIAFLYQEI